MSFFIARGEKWLDITPDNKLARVFVNAHERNMKNSFAVRFLSVLFALIIEQNGLGFSTTKGKIIELRFYSHARKQNLHYIKHL